MTKRGINTSRALVAACVLALVALALIVWAVLVPRPVPVMLAMTAGQLLGTLSLASFLVVVVYDMRRGRGHIIPNDPPPPLPPEPVERDPKVS